MDRLLGIYNGWRWVAATAATWARARPWLVTQSKTAETTLFFRRTSNYQSFCFTPWGHAAEFSAAGLVIFWEDGQLQARRDV